MRALPRLLAATAALGATLAYFFDPASGRRRRRSVRERTVAVLRRRSHRVRRLARHVSSDALGLARRLARRLPHEEPELDDATLAHKVESILFRDRDVPKGRINVNAEHGVVYLRGQVDEPELIDALENRVRRISGVRHVENLLHPPR